MSTHVADIAVSLVGPSSWCPVEATFSYDTADALVIQATFEDVVWILGRDLLFLGLSNPSGTGDVRVWPSSLPGSDSLHMHLHTPTGEALLEMSRAAVATFLRVTLKLVPLGSEESYLNFDALLAP